MHISKSGGGLAHKRDRVEDDGEIQAEPPVDGADDSKNIFFMLFQADARQGNRASKDL